MSKGQLSLFSLVQEDREELISFNYSLWKQEGSDHIINHGAGKLAGLGQGRVPHVSLECGGLQEVRLGIAGRVVAHRHLGNGIYTLPEAGMIDSDSTQLNAVAN